MVISGGDHLEWPTELESDKEIDMEQAFDEAMWEWVLEQGPPQDDDVVWLKKRAAYIGYLESTDEILETQGEKMLEAL